MKKSPWAVHAIATAVTTMLAACGGGGDNGSGFTGFPIAAAPAPAPAPAPSPAPSPAPAPAPTPAPPSADSSAPCFNEADLHAGTVLDVVESATPDGASTPGTSSRFTRTTGARTAFAGANPVAVDNTIYGATGQPIDGGPSFMDLVNGLVLNYGARSADGTSTTVNTPPAGFPVDMTPGQTASDNYTSTTSLSGGASVETDYTNSFTYVGRETLQIGLGTFNVCHFSATTSGKTGGTTPTTFTATSDTWTAVDGPYRGQALKGYVHAQGSTPGSTTEVTQITYSPQ